MIRCIKCWLIQTKKSKIVLVKFILCTTYIYNLSRRKCDLTICYKNFQWLTTFLDPPAVLKPYFPRTLSRCLLDWLLTLAPGFN